MCGTILMIAFMCINPFNFPGWILFFAWIGLMIDVIMSGIKFILEQWK